MVALVTVSPAPAWLAPFAVEEWQRVAPYLHGRKALHREGMRALENYCVAAGMVRECELLMQRDGRVVRVKDGLRTHPAFKMAANPWLSLETYDAAEPIRDVAALESQACWVGVDLSSVEDLTAVVAVVADGSGEGRRYDALATFFLPEAGLAKKAEKDRADYLRWREAGVLQVTPSNVIDHNAIVEHIVDLGKRYGVQEVAIDR